MYNPICLQPHLQGSPPISSLSQRLLPSPLRCASLLALLLASGALQAQNLNALYEAARAYDATYLSARSLAESAAFKAAQADALRLPSASLTGSATAAEIHTVTGASVGSGQTLTLHVSLADAMIDAGYQLHVDSAVEHGGIYEDDAVIGLASGSKQVSGTGYVSTLSVKM